MSKINIDASLQSFMDPLLTIARGTFAKDGNDETLTNSALLTFAGMGLVACVPGKNGPTWVPTQLLIEQSKQPARPIDLTAFMAECSASDGETDEPKMTGSLWLMIDDIVDRKRQQQPELAKRNCADGLLLSFAGLGLVSFDKFQGGEETWAATPNLLDKFESIRDGLSSRLAKYRKSEIRLDDHLKRLVEFNRNMLAKRFGKKPKRRAVTILFLLACERAGQVIAYKDDDGHLAWKASDAMLRSFE
jgi:hypothetical protein